MAAVCVACTVALSLCAPAQAAITRTGMLQATVTDNFRTGESTTRYSLESGQQEIAVLPTELAAEPGERVVVTGSVRGDRLVGAVEATSAGPQAAVAAGSHKVAVLLVTFPGEPAAPWPPGVSRSEVFTAANSVNAFYQEESYGGISLTGKLNADGDVFGWFSLSTPTAGCPYSTWKEAADEAAATAGVDLTGYQHLVYAFEWQSSCSWLGTASLNGDWAMINGNLFGVRRQVTAHELGHNLGLLHAGSWTCTSGGTRVQISDTCTASEYGDPFDTMGNMGTRHNNGWNLAKLGILGAQNVETVDASGNYSVQSALDPTTEPTVLRIPRTRTLNGNVSSWYYLEVRKKGGVFENFADASTTGVSIRATAGGSPETLLLDANPATAGFQDAPLGVGQSFDGGPVQITTLAAGGGSATVSVELDEEPPSAPTDLTATAGFEKVQLQWDASTDDFGVHHYVVFRDGVEVDTVAETSFLDSPVSLGDHEYVVYAEDATGNRSAPSEPETVTVEPDEDPPTAPSGLTATMGSEGVELAWIASSDDFGVGRYDVFRDGRQVGSVTSTSFSDLFSSAGDQGYVVYAVDEAGNRSTGSAPAMATVPEISGPLCAAGTCRVIYRHSGATAAWAAPPGVGEAEFTVEGAQGGNGLGGAGLDRGARVVATLGPLSVGEEATVSVGGAGTPYAEGGAGGFNGGGDGARGGGGGGYTSVMLDSALKLLAGGGGGEGSRGINVITAEEPGGGRGGQGGQTGTSGSPGVATTAHGATLGRGSGGGSGGGGGGSSFATPGVSATFTGGVRRGYGQVSIAYSNPIKAGKYSFTTLPGQELIVPAPLGVLSGASGPSGVSLTASVETQPGHGSLALNEDGSFIYTPTSGYFGGDSFTYRAADPSGNYATAQVVLTVAAPPAASISAPSAGGVYTAGQPVSTAFSCNEGDGGTGLSSCDDSTGTKTKGGGAGHLDTSTVGSHIYTVTAVSKDGLTDSASISYAVVSVPPNDPGKSPGDPEVPPRDPDELPPKVNLSLNVETESLHELLQAGRLLVAAKVNKAASVTLVGRAKLATRTRRAVRTRWVEVFKGKTVGFAGPSKKEVTLTLTRKGRETLRRLSKLRLAIAGQATDETGGASRRTVELTLQP